jgi:hypothetical protein
LFHHNYNLNPSLIFDFPKGKFRVVVMQRSYF